MNTMYTSVVEQTGNIGIMKAIGARNHDLMLLFLIESGMLGLIGGTVGIIIGFGIGKIVELIAISSGIDIFRSVITIELVIGSLLFSFFIGAIAGLLPARHAAKLQPVEALRYG
jgi:putative ABC transport system permease protein